MARILCSISGVEYNCEHIPVYLTARESHHPIFDIPTARLLQICPRWIEGELSSTENYLLYLALFNSTGLMEFRVPAVRTGNTDAIIAQTMAPLASIVERIYNSGTTKVTEILHLPKFVVTPDTKDLESSPDWVAIWNHCYKDYQDHYATSTALEKLNRQETILERYIRDHNKDISTYAVRIANWAADAAKFYDEDYEILNEHNKLESLCSYWKRIIVACAKTESIWDIPDADLNELIAHCEETIYHGSIYAHTLMSLLRAGAERKKNFLDIGDIDIGQHGTSFRILDANASVEDANKLALIDSAPLEMPIEKNYPNKLAFIKAKLNYQMKKDYENSQAVADKIAKEGLA